MRTLFVRDLYQPFGYVSTLGARQAAASAANVTVTKAQFEAVAGSPREIYIAGVDPHNAGPTDLVCDVAVPIRP